MIFKKKVTIIINLRNVLKEPYSLIHQEKKKNIKKMKITLWGKKTIFQHKR